MILRPRSRASSMALPIARNGENSSSSSNGLATNIVTTANGLGSGSGSTNTPYQATIYIMGWYFFSLSISIYNKWMFGPSLDFHYPILITSFHQFCLFLLSTTVLYCRPKLRPDVDLMTTNSPATNPTITITSASATAIRSSSSAKSSFRHLINSIKMPPSTFVRSILPCSLASAGDIGLSNVSFKFISLTLYTMLKTLSLGFVLIFGLLFGLEKFRWNLVLIVVTMLFSVLLMVNKRHTNQVEQEEEIDSSSQSIGIFLVLGASMMSGLRWSFTQILLKHNDYTSNSISTIFFLSPGMCTILFILGLIFEGWSDFTSSPVWAVRGIFQTIVLMIIPGLLAFMMTLCEFKLLSVAQVITLSIAGIFKELLTILLSLIIFGDRLSWINCIGLVLTFLDILWYNYYRYLQKNSTLNSTNSSKNEYLSVPTDDSGIEMKKL